MKTQVLSLPYQLELHRIEAFNFSMVHIYLTSAVLSTILALLIHRVISKRSVYRVSNLL
jgi:hypothetical protein